MPNQVSLTIDYLFRYGTLSKKWLNSPALPLHDDHQLLNTT